MIEFKKRRITLGQGHRRILATCTLAAVVLVGISHGQTVKIKFRYQPQASYIRVHFPGQFNNWGPNSSGMIAAGAPSQADSLESLTGLWVKTIALQFGTWQYKIYRQLSSNPTDWSWTPDPLNRVVIPPDQNSQFVVDSLVLFQICAYPYAIESGAGGDRFVVKTGIPSLSAGIFQPAGSPSLAIEATIDGALVPNATMFYDVSSGIFTYKPPTGVPDGPHVFKLRVTAGTQARTDSVTFEVRSRPVQILTPSFTTRKTTYITAGVIFRPDGTGLDSSTTSATIAVNGIERSVAVVNGSFEDSTTLVEGQNRIRVSTANGADSIVVTRIVDHAPHARVSSTSAAPSSVQLNAGESTDPDSQPLSFKWFDDPRSPLGLAGTTGPSVTIIRPTSPGEYFFGLIAADPDGHADTTISFFTISSDGSFSGATIASNPEWARKARVYFLFPKAASAAGTINAAAQRLQYIKDLGFNVIWLMPVMKNAYPIDQNYGPGYNIVDFYNVAPEYGSNDDFRNFVAQAHALGLKVILDVTPNHTSRFHPWSLDAHANKSKSPYWNWYEHSKITANTNGLGDCLDADNFNYYCGFSEQLLNFNWKDIDARTEMINVYKYWVTQFGLDGYRFDVYWGPHRRYGEQFMGNPVRDALKRVKPDILLLGEDDGTGGGTEVIYADNVSGGYSGGLDAAYDFKLYFNYIRGFNFGQSGINGFHTEIDNGGYYPGKNALYMRFMESQDEDRIVYFYSGSFVLDSVRTFKKTMPVASVLFTIPGFPMIWNGQEVGWGYGIPGAKERRNRSTINWEYGGKTVLAPHYQRLAHIRSQFPAFTQHKQDTDGDGQVTSRDTTDFVRVGSTNSITYAFTRPYENQNGLTVVNFSEFDETTTISLTGTGALKFAGGIQQGTQYYLNNLMANTRTLVSGSGLASIPVNLPAYGSAIFTVSLTQDSVRIEKPVVSVAPEQSLPSTYDLAQNYPNPFNPSTRIRYQIAGAGVVNLEIYDLLGREIISLVEETKGPGTYEAVWDGRNASGNLVAGGIYLYRLTATDETGQSLVMARKLVLLK